VTEMEPTSSGSEIVRQTFSPDFGKPTWAELREQRRVSRQAAAAEQLDYLRKALRQLKSDKLHDTRKAHAIRKAEELMAELERTDNPYIHRALDDAYWDWHRDAAQIIREGP
jgi:hypothetical protein